MKWLLGILIVSAVVWTTCAWYNCLGQRKLFMAEGKDALCDFWMPRDCLTGGYIRNDGRIASGWYTPEELAQGSVTPHEWWPGAVYRTGKADRVYPALALLPIGLFPATWTGGWCCTALACMAFLGALVVIAGNKVWPLIFICSMPIIFSLERGNPVWLSAAACGIFLAWWDDGACKKRVIAAICLAIAAVMKIAPALLGLIYLSEMIKARFSKESLQMPIIAFAGFLILFFLPWLAMPDGFSGILEFFENARGHEAHASRLSAFGLLPVWRIGRVILGLGVNHEWAGMCWCVWASQLLGLAAVIIGAYRKEYLLLVGGMLMAAGNMFYYGALYLLPVFVLKHSRDDLPRITLPLWFVILCPLQIVVMGHDGNPFLCNIALMALMVGAIVRLRRSDEKRAKILGL